MAFFRLCSLDPGGPVAVARPLTCPTSRGRKTGWPWYLSGFRLQRAATCDTVQGSPLGFRKPLQCSTRALCVDPTIISKGIGSVRPRVYPLSSLRTAPWLTQPGSSVSPWTLRVQNLNAHRHRRRFFLPLYPAAGMVIPARPGSASTAATTRGNSSTREDDHAGQ